MDVTFSLPISLFGITFIISYYHFVIFSLNIILLVFAGKIVNTFNYNKKDLSSKIWGFRFFNVSFFVLQVANIFLTGFKADYGQSLSKISFSLISTYIAYLIYHITSHFVDKKFGTKKIIDGNEVGIVSYSARMVNILLFGFVCFFTLVTIINIWGYESLLEATGMVGLFLGFLALSSSIWGPDLFHGLILLNSSTIEDGDILDLNGEYYIVHKTSFMETTLLDIANNCRTRMRNSTLANMKIDNLTKLAHSQGLRETLKYKIGYPADATMNTQIRKEKLDKFNSDVESMFNDAFDNCVKDENIKINPHIKFEKFLTNTGDFSLEYSISFYLVEVKKTRFTHQARSILRTKYLVNEKIFEKSIDYGVDLSTPVLLQNV